VKQYLGGTMEFAHAYLVVIALVAVMITLALHWNRAKKEYPLPSMLLRAAVIGAAAWVVA
jgi:hypothetical protein